MGFDYPTLQAVKADIRLTTGSGLGSEGPYGSKVGFDAVAQAMSGNMYMGGFPDDPRKAFVPYCDFGTASLAAFGTLAAIIHKMKTGEGQLVEGSLLRTSLTFANALLIEQSVIDVNRTGSGNRGQTSAPSDAFKTKDGWIMVQIVGRPLYERWARLMGEEHWLTDARFATDQLRGDNAEVISERLARWGKDKTNQEVLDILQEARIPCGEILSPQQALDNEHVVATGIFKQVDYPGLKKPAPIAEPPVKLSKTPGEFRYRAPTLGEPTAKLMAERGSTRAQHERLRQNQVI